MSIAIVSKAEYSFIDYNLKNIMIGFNSRIMKRKMLISGDRTERNLNKYKDAFDEDDEDKYIEFDKKGNVDNSFKEAIDDNIKRTVISFYYKYDYVLKRQQLLLNIHYFMFFGLIYDITNYRPYITLGITASYDGKVIEDFIIC